MLTRAEIETHTLVGNEHGGYYVCVLDGIFKFDSPEEELFILKRLCDGFTASMLLPQVIARFSKIEDHLTDRELFEYRLSGKLPTDRFVDGKLIPSGERCG